MSFRVLIKLLFISNFWETNKNKTKEKGLKTKDRECGRRRTSFVFVLPITYIVCFTSFVVESDLLCCEILAAKMLVCLRWMAEDKIAAHTNHVTWQLPLYVNIPKFLKKKKVTSNVVLPPFRNFN